LIHLIPLWINPQTTLLYSVDRSKITYNSFAQMTTSMHVKVGSDGHEDRTRERVKGKNRTHAILQEKKFEEHDWKKMKFSC
jgi:hypothetical protein